MIVRNTDHTERAHHRQAFQAYFAMGAKRNYAAIAVQFSVSRSTIKNWSRWFRWSQRVAVRQAYDTQLMAEETDQVIKEQIDRGKKVLDLAIARIAKKMAEGKLRGSPRDLLQLEKLKNRLTRWESQSETRATSQKFFLLPDKGQGDTGRPIIPESQLHDYLASIGHDCDDPDM